MINYPFLIIFLITLIAIFWHFNVIRKEIKQHNLIVYDLQNKLGQQSSLKDYLINQNSSIYIEKLNFKLSIIKNQIEILKQISINKYSN
ncbi:MAG TPA: hypothetical protein EYO76_03915 [Flavobacteriaceae bacterium]|nr:hypothetical protein [Flavobacteriaceae bacterium]